MRALRSYFRPRLTPSPATHPLPIVRRIVTCPSSRLSVFLLAWRLAPARMARSKLGRPKRHRLPCLSRCRGTSPSLPAHIRAPPLPSLALSPSGVVTLLQGRRLTCAWVGDSRCVLGRRGANGKITTLAMTTDHKPSVGAERQRIEAAGGRVQRLVRPPPFRRGSTRTQSLAQSPAACARAGLRHCHPPSLNYIPPARACLDRRWGLEGSWSARRESGSSRPGFRASL